VPAGRRALIRRYRSSRVAVVGTIGIAVFVVGAGLATTPLVLAAALFVAGASDSITDVAQNAHALRGSAAMAGRSSLRFHAVWAVGAILGGLMVRRDRGAHRGQRIWRSPPSCSVPVDRDQHTRICCAVPDHDDHPSALSGRREARATRYREIRCVALSFMIRSAGAPSGSLIPWAHSCISRSPDAPRRGVRTAAVGHVIR